MSELVISGYYGFGNAGDEAMLSAMIGAFRQLEPDVELTIISGNPADTMSRHGVKALHRLNFPGIIGALRRSDLLVSGGGSLLQDVTSCRSFYYYLSIMFLAIWLRKPFMLYAQGIGPLQGPLARWAMGFVGKRAAGITVRDEGSKEELASLGVTEQDIAVTADPVMCLNGMSCPAGKEILHKKDITGSGPLVGISVREWKGWEPYKQVIAATADKLVEERGATVVFLPMQWPQDVKASGKVRGLMRTESFEIDSEYPTPEIVSIIGCMDLLIGVRLHSLIFAALMEVPLVGISYDPKIERFMETLEDQPAGTLESITVDKLFAKIEEVWLNGGLDSKRNERISQLRQRALSNAKLALELARRN